MKILVLTIILLFITSQVLAMTLSLPFRCYKKTLTEEFEKAGIILDEEDEDSDGYIENKGSSYKIHLYSRPKDLQPFIDIPRKVEMMKNGN